MTQNRANPIVQRIGFAALIAVILAGCGGGETTTPPPPPPFVPQTITVNLGEHGGSITLRTTQAGGYTRDGQAFTSGTEVEAENGNRYRVTLSGQTWSAEFLPPDAVEVQLGSSGDTVSITRLEDRSYQADGEPLGEDGIVTAENGNMYRLTLEESGWMWAFVPPDAVTLDLGTSGTTVMITQLEDRSYEVNGQPLANDGIVTAANQNNYRLTLGDTGWMWEFVPPDAVTLDLGTSGTTVMITQLEDRSYEVDGQPLADDGIVMAANQNNYRLTLGDTGWMWEFVPPDTVSLDLGTSGTTVMITQLEDRSYEVNGQPLPGNRIVTADNGNMYRLSLDAAGWSWDFVPPDPVALMLGTSGDTVSITRVENGSYLVDGRPFTSGGVVEASNGNRYRLTLSGSMWDWEFIAPSAVAVPLGTSGTAVLIAQAEDGTYLVDGQPLADDRIVTAANGHRYRLTLTGQTWSAAFSPTPFPVNLGRLGGTRTVELREDGKYYLGNTEIESGDIIRGDNQKRYRLEFSNGVWQALFQADEITVPIAGSTDNLILFQLEDDTYYFGNTEVQSGDTVTGDDGNEYTLTLDASTRMWTAMSVVTTVTVDLGPGVEPIELTRLRDGTYERDGEPFPSGSVIRGSDGKFYRLVWNTDDTWSYYPIDGVIPTPDPPDPGTPTPTRSDNLETVEALPDTRPPTFRTADGSPDPDEGTTLVIVGSTGLTTPQEYSLHDLIGRGLVTESRTYIDAAREAIKKIRREIEIRDQAFSTGALNPHDEILGQGKSWDQLKDALALIFGASSDQQTAAETFLGDPPTGRRDDTLDVDEVDDVLAVIDEILDSLSTLAKFEAEVYVKLVTTDGNRLRDPSAEEVYEASFSRLQFGSSRNTRFAAYGIQQDGGSASAAATWDVGAFAYSPLEVSTRAMIPNRGEAQFDGDTIAIQAGSTATGDTTLYSGDIELRVRFGTGRVLGLITNLRDENNNLWTYDGTAIESIRLPIGEMGTGDATFTASGNSDLRFVSETPTSTFQGKFVGDDSDEADAVLGTWTIAGVTDVQGAVSGAFGAEYTRTRTSPRTAVESSPRGSRAETSIDFTLDAEGEITLGSFQGIEPSRLYSRGTSILRSTDSNQELTETLPQDVSLKLTVSYRKTDYTRYGVWEQERTAADDTVTVDQRGVFAYSYLEPTVFSTEPDSDHVYPANISATYSGVTIAMDHEEDPAIYTGSIEMTVNWNSAISAAALDSVVIRNLRSGSTYFAVDGEAVDRIVMAGAVTFLDASGDDGVRFTSSPTMEVWYRDPLQTRSSLTGTHEGRFVGLSLDGPVAVIGKWSVTSTEAPIDGAYGAHLQP